MDAVKFVEERRRMCNVTGKSPKYSLFNMSICAEDVVKEVAEWSAAHPRKTRNSEFLKHYPNARVDCHGVIDICPKAVDEEYTPVNGCCNTHCDGGTSCDECCCEYWMQEVE